MATTKEPTTEDLSQQIEQLKGDISRLTQTISDIGRSRGDEVARNVRAQARRAKATGEDQLAMLQLQANERLDEAEDYVRTNPATALGLAAGVGFIIGFLGTRR